MLIAEISLALWMDTIKCELSFPLNHIELNTGYERVPLTKLLVPYIFINKSDSLLGLLHERCQCNLCSIIL